MNITKNNIIDRALLQIERSLSEKEIISKKLNLKTPFPSFCGIEGFDLKIMKKNKEIGDQAIAYTRAKIKYVHSRGIEPPLTNEKKYDHKKRSIKHIKIQGSIYELCKYQPKEKKNALSESAIVAQMTRKTGYGNCDAMGSTLLTYLQEVQYQGRAATLAITRFWGAELPEGVPCQAILGNGHAVVALGLGPNSRVTNNDFYSFGVNAVICDPWLETESYSILEMYNRTQNYYGLDSNYRPRLAKIDPEFDLTTVLCSNISSSNEFLSPFLTYKIMTSLAFQIANLLYSFNIETSKEVRIRLADQMLARIPLLLKRLASMEKECALIFEEKIEIIKACRRNVYGLKSQLEVFKDPNTRPFDGYCWKG